MEKHPHQSQQESCRKTRDSLSLIRNGLGVAVALLSLSGTIVAAFFETPMQADVLVTIGVALILLISIADRLLDYDLAGGLRGLRVLIDVLSVLPSKGHPLSRGLQLPLLSSSGAPTTKDTSKLNGKSVLLLLMLPLGCTMAAGNAFTKLGDLAEQTETVIRHACGAGGSYYYRRCQAGDQGACKRFKRCYSGVLLTLALQEAVLAGKLAVISQVSGAEVTEQLRKAIELARKLRDWALEQQREKATP